jgi:hypothetical protein
MMIHRFWGGPPMPERYRDFGEDWAAMNDCNVHDWTMVELIALLREKGSQGVLAALDTLARMDRGRGTPEFFTWAADIAGYAILAFRGGVYVNCDIQPLQPLSMLGPGWDRSDWASYENETDWRVVNAAIGAAPNSQFWPLMLGRAVQGFMRHPDLEMVETTGPAALTNFVREWNMAGDRRPFVVHPVKAFNPVHWSEIEQGSDARARVQEAIMGGSIGLHHWGHRKTGRQNRIPS